MLRVAGARLCERASRFAQQGHLKTRMSRYARPKEKVKGIAASMGDGDGPRSGLRDRASPEWSETRHAASSPLAIARAARTMGARPCPMPHVESLAPNRLLLYRSGPQ